jgi:hypothetical protein
MRKLCSLLLAGMLLLACNNEKKTDTPKDNPDDTATTSTSGPGSQAPLAVNVIEKLLGSFVGAFGDNKITLLITRTQGDTIEGRSIVGGNNRPFSGVLMQKGSLVSITAKEPGDHPDDGVFEFSLAADQPDSIHGSWKPNNNKKTAKEYTLGRKQFEYKTDVGSWPEASQRLLKPKDVENYSKSDLEYMRNEIFARHGYCFKKKALRQSFENEEWYVPATVDIKGLLTDIEKKNIELIKRYEKYAAEYGDEYGR